MRFSTVRFIAILGMVVMFLAWGTGCEPAKENLDKVAVDSPSPPPPPVDTTYITSPDTGQSGTVTLPAYNNAKVNLSMYTVKIIASPGTVINNRWMPGPSASVTAINSIGSAPRLPYTLPTTGIADQPVNVVISVGQTDGGK